ncbi:multiheme c-type cytochrome [Shewanella sp. MBTL60-007]|uniref:multiheme c-type cytochrome n=1 Tax=Shewanella sp. MBTL60-007 TaxID=2815911 RepID=UPI001BC15B83|nr:multiheme c-type cytochrome [Shewanella sp. MBTL60-007]GIU31874.1 hypothetical protein TUM3792_43970 [Shewanella sp. MBTL60-007]
MENVIIFNRYVSALLVTEYQMMIKQRDLVELMKSVLFILFISLISHFADGAELVGESHFVGVNSCVECHQKQVAEWQTSQHAQAMGHASDETVLADFNQASLMFEGKENRFFRKGKEFWVNIEGPDNQFVDYQIKYTFGVYPLQQYMVEFDDGRVQLIPYTWDARTKEEGGQRWYHLYPQFTQESDEFFWLNEGQNWNYMCADCHSTNVKKGYNKQKNTYQTTWSEINVSCEACHGAASEHIKWTSHKNETANKGFDRTLQPSVTNWRDNGTRIRGPQALQSSQQLTACAQCHSRGVKLNESTDNIQNNEYLDRQQLTLINSELYHSDGQIYDENYVYGSFLQSKMSQAGVVCSNCHNPHTGKIKMAEPALCLQCHSPTHYASEVHSHHKAGTEGSLCSDCHMVEEKYMQVDLRKDHSWQIPRPDLSEKIGVPNACVSCHKEKDNKWASAMLAQWFPDSVIQNSAHFSQAFFAADNRHQGAQIRLKEVAENKQLSSIITASALERLAQYPGQLAYKTSLASLKSSSSLVRMGAVQAMAPYSPEQQWQALSPMLDDAVLSIRLLTASILVPQWPRLTLQQQALLKPSLDEYLAVQEYNSDRAGRTNIANVYRHQGLLAKAEAEYLGAIQVEPIYVLSYINLADLYRTLQRNDQAIAILKQGLSVVKQSGVLHHALGLAYIRDKNMTLAKAHLLNATIFEPANARFHYIYALAVEAQDQVQAEQSLIKAYEVSQDPQYLYQQCDFLIRHKRKNAASCVEQLEELVPVSAVKALKRKL